MKTFNNITQANFKKYLASDWQGKQTVLHYTGSMFGIGCSAFDESGLSRINNLKQRQGKSGFIVLIPKIEWLDRYGIVYDNKMRHLLQQYWPGNLSVILDDPENRFEYVSFEGKVAFRVPTDTLLRDYIEAVDAPMVSTSINISGEEPLMTLEDINRSKQDWFDLAILPEKIEEGEAKPSTLIHMASFGLACIREGSIKFKKIKLAYKKPQILFVCTGNTCRSPMAEYWLRKKLEENELPFRVSSAGFSRESERISLKAWDVLAENGIESHDHFSQMVQADILADSWLILTMTAAHKYKLLEMAPDIESRVFTLSEYTGLSDDIADPYGREIYYYQEAFKMIRDRIEILIEKLKQEI